MRYWEQEEKGMTEDEIVGWHHQLNGHAPAAAAAKLLQSCLTLCESIDGSPPGSPVPGMVMDREDCRAAVHGVTRSQTRLSY